MTNADDRPPVSEMLRSIVGCKWSLQVLASIRDGLDRPSEIERRCPGISTKVLNERLRKLVRFGLVERVAYDEIPPRVEYPLTAFGRRFLGLLDEVDALQDELEGGGEGATYGQRFVDELKRLGMGSVLTGRLSYKQIQELKRADREGVVTALRGSDYAVLQLVRDNGPEDAAKELALRVTAASRDTALAIAVFGIAFF